MTDILTLTLASAGTGFLHTLIGPDHYVPFVAMSRAGNWSFRKTMWITSLCGVGHVIGSVVLGIIGLAVGTAVFQLEALEAVRGDMAGWLLLGFGLAYLVWGLHRALRNVPHTHAHSHDDGATHNHEHTHTGEHSHVHQQAKRGASMTPWVLFVIFVLGPCEPLIPLFMYPAATGSAWHVVLVTLAFSVTTMITMLGMVAALHHGVRFIRLGRAERFGHAIAGLVVVAAGLAIQIGL